MSSEKLDARVRFIKDAQEKGDMPMIHAHLGALKVLLQSNKESISTLPKSVEEILGTRDVEPAITLLDEYTKPVGQFDAPAPITLACWGATLRAFENVEAELVEIYPKAAQSNELDRSVGVAQLRDDIAEAALDLSKTHPLVLEMMVEERSQNNPKLKAFQKEAHSLRDEFADVVDRESKLYALELKAHKIIQEEYPRYSGVRPELVKKAVGFSKIAQAKLQEQIEGVDLTTLVLPAPKVSIASKTPKVQAQEIGKGLKKPKRRKSPLLDKMRGLSKKRSTQPSL
jgi:hypothetical protein